MKMDMVNFTIQSLRPHLQDRSIEYERKKFQELLDKLPSKSGKGREVLGFAASPSRVIFQGLGITLCGTAGA